MYSLDMTLEWSQPNGKGSAHHEQIDEALINMLAVDFQPASIVKDKGFLSRVPATKSPYHHEKYSSWWVSRKHLNQNSVRSSTVPYWMQ